MKKTLTSAILLPVVFWMAAAQEQKTPDYPQVSISTTKGEIVVELKPDKAPVTVENFLEYVKSGFYDNTIFHRVIKGFMIQGGRPHCGFKQEENP